MDSKIHPTDLEPDGGARTMHVHYVLPLSLLISARSFYIQYFEEVLEDGSHLTVDTTKGMEAIAEANKQRTGKDVVGTVIVEYFKITPFKGGCYALKINQAHLGGSLPRKHIPSSEIVRDSKKEMEEYYHFLRDKVKTE